MMTNPTPSYRDQLLSDPELRRLYEEERTVLDATEAIVEAMESRGLTRAQLADELGTSRAHITQMLRGTRNLTLRTISKIAYALGMQADVHLTPLEDAILVPIEVDSPAMRDTREYPVQNLLPAEAAGQYARPANGTTQDELLAA